MKKAIRKLILILGFTLGLGSGVFTAGCINQVPSNPLDSAALQGYFTNLVVFVVVNHCIFDSPAHPTDDRCVWSF